MLTNSTNWTLQNTLTCRTRRFKGENSLIYWSTEKLRYNLQGKIRYEKEESKISFGQ